MRILFEVAVPMKELISGLSMGNCQIMDSEIYLRYQRDKCKGNIKIGDYWKNLKHKMKPVKFGGFNIIGALINNNLALLKCETNDPHIYVDHAQYKELITFNN